MRLVSLDIRRYRSIREQSGEDSIEFEGLDCLVGKNNAGKTNILSAIKFLLDAPEKELDDELYWQKETGQTVSVHGFFAVDDEDLERIEDDAKREAVSESLLDNELLEENGHQSLASDSERLLGICKQVSDGHSSPDSMLLDFRPEDDGLSIEHLEEYRDSRWEDQKDGDKSYSKSDYERDMEEEFPEVAELIDSRHDQKGIWKDKLEEYIQSRPSEVDFALEPTEFRQGTKTIILGQFLPQVISIPAIREVESTTKRGGEFGDLVKQISSEIQEELDQQLRDELDSFQPRDHASIDRVEGQINQYLGGTFNEQSVQIDFPSFSTEYLFKNADIRIQEDYVEDLSKDNVGEGVKRTVIFSLLRTLADLRSGRFSLTEETEPVDNPRPLLVLYEEAELFLHPSLQKTLLNALDELSASGSQVVFSTHSPIMIQHDLLDTINIVRKREEQGTNVTQFHRILDQRDPADRSRLTDLQSVSSYIFSEKVVLVEGMSDKIVFEKLCPHLNPEWDFDKQSIPVLNAGGKGDACRFRRFLDDLGIETFVIFDIDAVKQECQTVVTTDAALEAIGELNQAVESHFEGSQYSVEGLETAVRTKPWTTAFEELEDLKDRMANGGETTDSDADLIDKVLSKCEVENPPNHLWTADEVCDRRIAVVEKLLDENILLLSGELEDYYPCAGGGKREMALEFDPTEHEADDIRDLFHPLDSHSNTDVEEFLTRVFETAS